MPKSIKHKNGIRGDIVMIRDQTKREQVRIRCYTAAEQACEKKRSEQAQYKSNR